MVLKSFDLFDQLTIVENLILAMSQLLKRDEADVCERSMELLREVGMADKALSLPAQLSDGQKQRVAIMHAVAMDPTTPLFDVPISALDPTMVGEVLAVILNLAKDGMTMMVVTHEMHFAKDVSSRVLFMDEGTVLEEVAPEEVFDHPQMSRTRQFNYRLQVFEATMRKDSLNALELTSAIERFCLKHTIAGRLMHRMLTVAEELCVQTILPRLAHDEELRLTFDYDDSHTGSLTM